MEPDVEKQSGISLSATRAKLESTSDESSRLLNCKLEWRDISYSVNTKGGKKQILQNVCGCVESGTSINLTFRNLIQAPCSGSWALLVVEKLLS
jgi:hypothetical protein